MSYVRLAQLQPSREHMPTRVDRRVLPDVSSNAWARLAVVVAVPLFSACSSARLSHGAIERNIGHATYRDIALSVPDILRRYGYVIYTSRSTENQLYFETNWKPRAPFEDEAARGANAARTRIIVRARKSSSQFFTLRLQAQNEVSGVPNASDLAGTGWSTIPATEMYKAYVLELSTEIQLKVDTGMRVR